jgi:hypothetical protein
MNEIADQFQSAEMKKALDDLGFGSGEVDATTMTTKLDVIIASNKDSLTSSSSAYWNQLAASLKDQANSPHFPYNNLTVVLSPSGERVQANDAILSSRSDWFSKQIKEQMKKTKTTTSGETLLLELNESEPRAFRSFINYLYTGSISDEANANDHLESLRLIASKYQVTK